jgi:hypothetical protein
MVHTHRIAACLTLAGVTFAAGCKGCNGESGAVTAAATEPQRSEQSARARVLSRLSARKLDRDKVYAKDADGVVLCGADVDCFIVQAERCANASLDHILVNSGYGITQRVQARYRIAGNEAGRCKVERRVMAIDAAIDPVMVEALRKRGKTEQEIEGNRAQALDNLRRRHPARLECFFDDTQLLETILNLADGRHDRDSWSAACRELEAPPPAEEIAKKQRAEGAENAPAEATNQP